MANNTVIPTADSMPADERRPQRSSLGAEEIALIKKYFPRADIKNGAGVHFLRDIYYFIAQGEEKQQLANTLRSLGGLLNFLQRDPVAFLQDGSKEEGALSAAQIEEQINARIAAKQAKDFAKADFIRKTLLEQGIVLEDKPGGITEWRRA